MGQSQILEGLSTTNIGPAVTSVQFQSSGCSTSVLYQSTVTPTFYTSTGSPFHSNGAFLPPAVDDRKEYVAVLPAGVQINDASGLIPASGRGTLASVGTVDTASSVAQLTAVPLSHVQLAPVQLANDGQSNTQQQIIYEHYYVDQQHPSTSSTINATSRGLLSETTSSGAENGKDFANKSGSSETCSLSGSDTAAALQLKRQKQADAARQRYQRMTLEERKEVNQKRTEAQKRKRQKDKELEELESLLRQSKDIEDDPAINEQLREKRIRARRAEAARLRYQRMSSEERRAYNQRRRFRQLGIQGGDVVFAALFLVVFSWTVIERGDLIEADSKGAKKNGMDEEKLRQHIIEQNAKKAEAARLRYHRMTDEEKRQYNQRRTEAFRRRRIEEEILLSTPAGRISAEALNRAQQIMLRNAKRAEAARLRYQRMTPEQRRAYNQKRSRAKKERERVMRAASEDAMSSLSSSINGNESSTQVNSSNTAVEQKPIIDSVVSEEVLSTLERDVLKRTRQANMVLMRQKRLPPQEQFVIVSTNPDGTQTVIPATTTEDGKQIFHIPATATTTEDGKQVFHIPAITQQLISTDPNTLTLVDDSSKLLGTAQQPLQITSVPQLLGLSQQQHSNSHDHGETSHQVAMTQQQQIIPQLAELHNVQEGGGGADEAQHTARENQVDAHGQIQAHQQQSSQQHMQQQTQPQHIIVTLQEHQQPMQHQIIVTDLNQATGAVLSSMGGHGRSRGRPPMYAAAAAAIQQQQGSVMLPPGQANFVTITATPMISEAEIKPPYRVTAPRHMNTAPSRRDILAVATAASVGPTTGISPEQKLEIQRAKRAERARLRYHNMSAEERRNFNARRAKALRTARMRDDELCRMAERAQMSGTTLDADLMIQVAEAQRRRAKRAEAARLKYHRMSSEERRQYNAMRDAQRRQRLVIIKRQKEEQELLERERQQQEQQQQQQQNEIHQETREQDANREGNNEQILYDSYIRYDSQMDHGWAVQS
uniref:Bm9871 n=1 Tax=Brugia malayi TaxID=6279 RepID=A0A1I9G292_BRUMA|nr:Bm9871 [Brugia malayi]